MAYSVIHLADLAELKTRMGTAMLVYATILGVDFPTTKEYKIYAWDGASTATGDDDSIVVSDISAIGRWIKVGYDSSLLRNYFYYKSETNDLLDNKVDVDDLVDVAYSGDYNDLNNTPTIFDGDYNSLTNKPSIPSSQVNSDWNSSTGVSAILNKPILFSGAYSDLTGKPTIPSAQVNSDWNSVSGISQVLNKPVLASVATSGSYTDLTSKPSIPAAQIQSDWTQVSTGSLDYIKNKPSLALVATSGSYVDLTNKPTIYSFTGSSSQYTKGDGTYGTLATVATTGSYNDLSNQPSIPTPATYYNASGSMSAPTKVWMGTVTPTTGNGYSINISSAGFSTILGYQVIVNKNNSTANSSANVSVKSVSTSALVVNIVEGNASTTTILGINVLSGAPLDWANTTGMTLSVIVFGT